MFRSLIAASAALLLSLSAAAAQETAPADDAQETPEAVITVEDMQMGDPEAKVTVIEYASFTCPHCASFHAENLKKLKEDFVDTGKISFIYREVYFDRFGLWASMIARCGGAEGFFGIADQIYAEQKDWVRAGSPAEMVDALRKIGKLRGLTDEKLDACLQDADQAQALVNWYQSNAEQDGISSTPSFVINGTRYKNMAYDDMADLINKALEE